MRYADNRSKQEKAVRVSNNGSICIPKHYREKYNLQAGSSVAIVDYGGILAGAIALTKVLLVERNREHKREI